MAACPSPGRMNDGTKRGLTTPRWDVNEQPLDMTERYGLKVVAHGFKSPTGLKLRVVHVRPSMLEEGQQALFTLLAFLGQLQLANPRLQLPPSCGWDLTQI